MKNIGLIYIGEGIAFAALCIAAAWLEVSGKNAAGLWFLVVLWAVLFGPSEEKVKGYRDR